MTVKRSFSLPDEISKKLDAAAQAGGASAVVAQALNEKFTRDETAEKIRAVWGEPDPAAMAYWMRRLTGEDDAQPADAADQRAS